jgi:hypothetical protein
MQKNHSILTKQQPTKLYACRKSARWRLQVTVVKWTYQLQSLYLPSFGIELGKERFNLPLRHTSVLSKVWIHFEIHLEIIIFRGLSPLLLKVRGAQIPAAPVVPTAMVWKTWNIICAVSKFKKIKIKFYSVWTLSEQCWQIYKIQQTIGRKLTIYNWQFNKLTICLYVTIPRDKAFSLRFRFRFINKNYIATKGWIT